MKKFTGILLCLIFILMTFASCSAGGSEADVENGTIAVVRDTVFADIVRESYPDASISYYNTVSETVSAVKTGKADAFILEDASIDHLFSTEQGFSLYGDTIGTVDNCFIFLKGFDEEFESNLDTFISDLSASGELQEIVMTYSSSEETHESLPESTSDGSAGSFVCVDTSDRFPFCYLENGEITGIDAAILRLFANKYNYDIGIEDYDSASLLETISTGKCDFAGSGITYTKERAKEYDFSVPYLTCNVSMAVYGADTSENQSLLSELSESFYKNFILESRWKLFLQGIGTTILITLLSAVFGSAAGFLLYVIYAQSKKSRWFLRAVSYLIHGMPVLVLIMILYYIVFPHTNLSGTVVSIIGFSFVFAFTVFDMIKDSVDAIDVGQFEAAFTLGYGFRKTYLRWIFPQAFSSLIPSYKSALMSLIESTSVVGFIAVLDLTKASDIIRSMTYESFFPLIITAVIYFILGALLMLVTGKIADLVNPCRRKRKKFLKGVKTK